VHVVGEHLPNGTIVDAGPDTVARPEPHALERHPVRVEHPHDVVVGRDEEPAGRVEPRRGIGEKPHVDVPVRAHDRQLGDAAIQVEAELGDGLDVPVGPQIRHSPSPGFGRYANGSPSRESRGSSASSGNRSSASSSAR